MSKTWDGSGGPRAVIHKRILDVAGDNPDASLADIADEVSGANADLVDQVLSKYGDPGETDSQDDTDMSQNGHQNVDAEQADDPAGNADPDAAETPATPDELTGKQLETLGLVYENTDATQGDIADRLGVTRATVSRRLGDIPGFEWSDREAFTSTLFDDTEFDTDAPVGDSGAGAATGAPDDSGDGRATADGVPDGPTSESDAAAAADTEASLDGLEQRLATVEETLDADDTAGESPLRRELAHRVVHAAMESDRISEEEELELIAGLLD